MVAVVKVCTELIYIITSLQCVDYWYVVLRAIHDIPVNPAYHSMPQIIYIILPVYSYAYTLCCT